MSSTTLCEANNHLAWHLMGTAREVAREIAARVATTTLTDELDPDLISDDEKALMHFVINGAHEVHRAQVAYDLVAEMHDFHHEQNGGTH